MVYQTISVKSRTLEILRQDPGAFISGEDLASKQGVSRVAVWKAVKALCLMGYPITVGEKGYCWKPLSHGDFLYPWEFGEKEPFFHHFDSTDSTMNRAAELAGRGCPGGTVITAGEQTAGRGRNNRPWVSEHGGLFFTLLERQAMNAAEYFRFSLALQIAAARCLSRICGKQVQPRWSNDLYVDGKKIAGILTEFHAEGDLLVWISLGVGINVNNRPHSKESTNCANVAGHPLSRQEVLRSILHEWELTKKEVNSPMLCKEWNSLAWGIGKKAAVVENKSCKKDRSSRSEKTGIIADGIFSGIDEHGRGVIKEENGKKKVFIPGKVSIQF